MQCHRVDVLHHTVWIDIEPICTVVSLYLSVFVVQYFCLWSDEFKQAAFRDAPTTVS